MYIRQKVNCIPIQYKCTHKSFIYISMLQVERRHFNKHTFINKSVSYTISYVIIHAKPRFWSMNMSYHCVEESIYKITQKYVWLVQCILSVMAKGAETCTLSWQRSGHIWLTNDGLWSKHFLRVETKVKTLQSHSVEQRLGFKMVAENMALIMRSKDRDRLLDYCSQSSLVKLQK